MANLANFIYCLNAERIISPDMQSENINAIGIISTIIPEFVPGTFSFSIIFSILDIDTKEHNNIRITFSQYDSKIPLVDSGIIQLPPLPENHEIKIPNQYSGLNMTMDFRNVIFEKEGLYNTCIYFNGNLLSGENYIYAKGKRELSW